MIGFGIGAFLGFLAGIVFTGILIIISKVVANEQERGKDEIN